jgi:hypothetical protein
MILKTLCLWHKPPSVDLLASACQTKSESGNQHFRR